MKRFLTILLASLAVAGLLCVGVSASSFDGAAAELASIGVLKGSAEGFQLDQVPTRAQAAIMLVRLFGAEEEAKAAYAAGDLQCPFADVNETAAPYVAWLADKGLASGVADGSFGAANPCSAKAYTIFLLRALGYQDNVDFTSANAQDFALTIGLLDTSAFTGTFLRDDLVALTYQALGTNLKGGDTYLLASLIESGAIDASAAKPITDKIETYQALQASGAAAAKGMDVSVDAKVGITIDMKGSDESMNLSQKAEAAVKGDIKMVLDQEDLQMAMNMTVTATDGETSETEKMEYWLKDGVAYVRSGEEAYQMPMDMGMDMESLAALMDQSSAQTGAAMLPFIDAITAKTSGGNTVYTLKLNNAFTGMVNGLLGQILGAAGTAGLDMDMNFSLENSAITYTVGQDGALKNAGIDMTLKAGVNASDGTDSLVMNLRVDMDMTMDVNAMGGSVKISFPDFSGFEEIIGGADGPTGIFVTPAA